MAKDQFYRTKPHVNVGTLIRLEQQGFSALGVRQIATGQTITAPQDRALTAEILGTIGHNAGPGREVKYYTITLTNSTAIPRMGWEVNLQITPDSNGSSGPTGKRQHKAFSYKPVQALVRLHELGFSNLGAHQIATHQIVTDPHDRDLVAEILTRAAVPHLMQICFRNDTIR